MSSVRMTEAELQEWILRKLGAPQFPVELSQPDLDMAVGDAKRWFAAKRSIYREWKTQLRGGTQDIPLPDDADMVVEVLWPDTGNSVAAALGAAAGTWLLPDGGIPRSMVPGDMPFGGMIQARQYTDTIRKMTGTAPEWDQPNYRTLRVFTPSTMSGPVIVRYKATVIAFTDLNVRELDLVYRYALAVAKEKLGRIRTRFDGAVSSQGTTGQDGASLLQEAETAMMELDELLQQSAAPLPIVIG